jgi:hypothetical protein
MYCNDRKEQEDCVWFMVLLFLHTSWFCCCCLIAFYFYSFSSLTQKSKRHRSHRLFVSRYLTIKIGLLNSPPPPSNLMLLTD